MIEDNKSATQILLNPWHNVYWFARMLINGDKYGAVGKDDKLLAEISASLRFILADSKLTDEQKIEIAKKALIKLINDKYQRASSRVERANLFCDDVSMRIKTLEDIAVFILTCENVMLPINTAIGQIPNNDREYTINIARSYLDELGEKGLATVVNFWDDAGVEGCLNAERTVVVREFGKLRTLISNYNLSDSDLILTAFTQEFERRLGQKRKGRAGTSLEDVASFLFEYFGIKAANKPEHFQADIEVDKWIKCKDKWLIGISCKRTLRERWKQVSSADASILSKFKIKEMWHLVTYDEDLSDDKLTLLGGLRHVFYLRDDSRRLISAQKHIGMKDYVRPMSNFISDIKSQI